MTISLTSKKYSKMNYRNQLKSYHSLTQLLQRKLKNQNNNKKLKKILELLSRNRNKKYQSLYRPSKSKSKEPNNFINPKKNNKYSKQIFKSQSKRKESNLNQLSHSSQLSSHSKIQLSNNLHQNLTNRKHQWSKRRLKKSNKYKLFLLPIHSSPKLIRLPRRLQRNQKANRKKKRML